MDRYRDAIMPPDSLLYPHGKTAERTAGTESSL
jgi:hypothetical protein